MKASVSRSDVVRVVAYLRVAYPSLEPTGELLDVWTDILREHPLEIVQQAARKYIADGNEYPPNLGAFVAVVKRLEFLLIPPPPIKRQPYIKAQPRHYKLRAPEENDHHAS